MKSNVTVYIQLLEECTTTARPTETKNLENGEYKVLPTPDYDPEDEIWEFLPGSIVRCEKWNSSSGEVLLAVEKLD